MCQIIKWCLYRPKSLQAIFCYCSYTWAEQLMSTPLRYLLQLLVQGLSGSPSVLSGISSMSIRDAEGPGCHGSGVLLKCKSVRISSSHIKGTLMYLLNGSD